MNGKSPIFYPTTCILPQERPVALQTSGSFAKELSEDSAFATYSTQESVLYRKKGLLQGVCCGRMQCVSCGMGWLQLVGSIKF